MKISKKLLAVLLAALLVLSMGVSAFADGPAKAPTTGNITITNAIEGVSYTAYKLFEAELDTSNGNTAPYPITYSIMSKLTIPDPDDEGETITVDNPVYKLLTENTDLKADFVLTPSTTVENKYRVEYKNNTTTTLSAKDVAAFQSLYDEEMADALALLYSKTVDATDDIVTFSGVPFGYYMIASEDDDTNVVLNINSTNPDATIALKAERTPSNPDKVEDKTEVGDAVCVTYNTSVKAVNFVTSDKGVTNQVFSYSLKDIPDYTNGAAGNDAAWVKPVYIRVYDAKVLKDNGKLNDDGSIKKKSNGLYDLDGIGTEGYTEVKAYAGTPLSHYAQDPDTEKYEVTWEKIDDYGYYCAVSESGAVDYYTTRIPWVKQPAEGSTAYEPLYYPVSYIVAEYQQWIDQDVNEVVGTTFDGTYTNYVDYKYDIKTASDIEIGSDSVTAFVTGLSLRKHATGETDDTKVLEGAVYIAYMTKEEKDPQDDQKTVTAYYSYREYTGDDYKKLVLEAQNKFISEYPNADIEKYSEATETTKPKKSEIDAYMNEHPVSHTAWVKETGKDFDPAKFTTWEATKLSADNSYKTVEIKNLTNETFYLQEVEAPAGYLCPTVPYIVTVTPTDDMTSSQKHFTITIDNQSDPDLPAAEIDANNNNFYTAQLYDGTSKALPTTGGMGTTIFYIVGSVMLIGAAVLLVTKKRMGAND